MIERNRSYSVEEVGLADEFSSHHSARIVPGRGHGVCPAEASSVARTNSSCHEKPSHAISQVSLISLIECDVQCTTCHK